MFLQVRRDAGVQYLMVVGSGEGGQQEKQYCTVVKVTVTEAKLPGLESWFLYLPSL